MGAKLLPKGASVSDSNSFSQLKEFFSDIFRSKQYLLVVRFSRSHSEGKRSIFKTDNSSISRHGAF